MQLKNLTLNIEGLKGSRLPKEFTTDLTRLKQVLTNLFTNALKFTTNGGITFDMEVLDESKKIIEVNVKDTGFGIPAEKLS